MSPQPTPRRALLIFAEDARRDLARRKLPLAALPLLQFPSLGQEPAISADIHLFTSNTTPSRRGIHSHLREGGTFGARFEHAIEALVALGYDEIVAIGRDCPHLRATDIVQAFAQLSRSQLVLGPDHRGGCYLIAFRAGDRALFRGIRWNQNTDCAQLRARCRETGVFLLATKQDLDSWADLRGIARGGDWIAEVACAVIRRVILAAGCALEFVDLARHFVRVRGQMPPPALAS